ncbi:predicted protein [Chaetomium globosum CBS 148.51]|uniref:Uncharacterized protein n=1 Tax=Chaetomium globosum (strain ATCC 6205 / CBS 148.51 / DSM 1962 / NBRC 6347 / NRRL 1970) TaxID=306901 RepID=Q2H840_CHAGB|nr:uncharacterized protein CHGG_03614 [Chaetomium globosum CBS 148.51]EAQ91679.1 predicted protein [Chaetomium globosum CBS 148.51]
MLLDPRPGGILKLPVSHSRLWVGSLDLQGMFALGNSEHPSFTSVLAGHHHRCSGASSTQEGDGGCQKLLQVAAEGRTMHCNYRIPDIIACWPKHPKGGQGIKERTVFSLHRISILGFPHHIERPCLVSREQVPAASDGNCASFHALTTP